MAITFPSESTDARVSVVVPERSTSEGWFEFHGEPRLPLTEEQERLIGLLIERSRDPHGFDRDVLLRIDEEAWGITD